MKSLIILAALTALSTSNLLPAPAIPTQYAAPPEANSLTICRDGTKHCEIQYNVYSSPQPTTHQKGCINIDDPIKKMAMHPSSDLNCTLFFLESCRYGSSSSSADKSPQGTWNNVFHGLVAPGIETFDSDEWKVRGFASYGAYGQPPKSVLCFPKMGAVGLGV